MKDIRRRNMSRETANILDNLYQLKKSIENCHPQVPSLAVDTALIIEKYLSFKNIDEFYADQSIEDLNKLTKQFEENCICESTGSPFRKKLENTL
jgi:hypothetical protein